MQCTIVAECARGYFVFCNFAGCQLVTSYRSGINLSLILPSAYLFLCSNRSLGVRIVPAFLVRERFWSNAPEPGVAVPVTVLPSRPFAFLLHGGGRWLLHKIHECQKVQIIMDKLDEQIASLREGNTLTENEVKALCDKVTTDPLCFKR